MDEKPKATVFICEPAMLRMTDDGRLTFKCVDEFAFSAAGGALRFVWHGETYILSPAVKWAVVMRNTEPKDSVGE